MVMSRQIRAQNEIDFFSSPHVPGIRQESSPEFAIIAFRTASQPCSAHFLKNHSPTAIDQF